MNDDTDGICKVCGEFVTFPDGLDPSEYCNLCAQEEVVRLIATCAAQEKELAALKAKCERLEKVFWADLRNFEGAPCNLCGYNGELYFQPGTHPCAKRYHELKEPR